MEPRLVERAAFTVMGLQERFTQETEDFEGIWKPSEPWSSASQDERQHTCP